ncbi:PepSY domain-containing protein [Flavisphingomonas formosensis]|uniref:PepSY domain-containing protein n=1 Tax=Flavisphingomonas formosensis TaxID=861534 RepID=UPI001E344650|nr:PepSY domain-containing protein [Sphingomonas formosensis]
MPPLPRPILLLHRWLGVTIGLIMTIWCLSGFVMLYSDYPRLLPTEQIRGLEPIAPGAARMLDRIPIAPDTALASARIEMLAGRPVLRIRPAIDPGRPTAQMRALPSAYDLSSGRPLAPLSPDATLAAGRSFGARFGIAGPAERAVPLRFDQWTVQTFRGHQPLYRIDYADPAGSTAYVAGNDGEIVQQTTRRERILGWLGAVPHWLYPTMLREDGTLWSQVVIWTSLAGCFLVVVGLWVGLARLRRTRDGRIGSPYRGHWWWHHIFGLLFGLLTLSWVASGLFSMNPWGFLDSMAGFAERGRLAGRLDWAATRSAFSSLQAVPAGTVRIEAAPLGGRIHVIAIASNAGIARFDATGHPARLSRPELEAALARGPKLASLELLRDEDDYYYAHRFAVKLPVWRAVLADDQRTRLYIDPDSGILLRALDRNARGFRWLQDGLHSLDLPPLRRHPLRDMIVLPLLAGVTLICATGTWMGFSRLRRDLRRRWRRVRSRP